MMVIISLIYWEAVSRCMHARDNWLYILVGDILSPSVSYLFHLLINPTTLSCGAENSANFQFCYVAVTSIVLLLLLLLLLLVVVTVAVI